MSSKTAKTKTKTATSAGKASGAKSAPKRPTVASLAQNLKSLESRLKGADTKNRNAIKALEKVVAGIKTSAEHGSFDQQAALKQGLTQLEIRIETYLARSAAEAKASVRSELSAVTAAGADLATLETALSAAHARLDAMDKSQRESLARLNRHIAGLATSVENRLISETKAREAATRALDAKIDSVRDHVETRVDRVEEETANALEVVGAKVAEFAAILEKRAESSDAETAERLADLAQETQSEFSAAQSDVTARLEALEVIAAAWSPAEAATDSVANPYLPANEDDPRMDQMAETIRSLQEELSRVHAQIATVQSPSSGYVDDITPHMVPQNIVPISTAPGYSADNPYAAAAQALEATAKPVTTAESEKKKSKRGSNAPDSHVPPEWDPAAFAPHVDPQQHFPTTPLSPAPMAPPPVPPAPIANPAAPPMASAGGHAPSATTLPDGEPLMPAPLPVSTYADPAYAEGDDMRAERIGGPKKSKNKKAKKRKNKTKAQSKSPAAGRNLRIGALAVGVAVAGLFAAKTLLGTPNSGDLTIASNDLPNMSPTIGSGDMDAQISNSSIVETTPPPSEPIGQYEETKTPSFAGGQQDTLDAAVAAGNPIAQFQKGLAQLQAGQMEEGARLIRLSANRNQPAAQYRLAKLYESGTGIAKDPITARELIERAALGGNRIAMHDLGNYHAYGQGGLKPDMNAALDWFSKAAERGVVDSQFNVAFLREGNEGVSADTETALFWYHVAARQGDQGAPDRIAVLNGQVDEATRADIVARAARFNPKPVDEAANGIFRNVAWAKPAGVANAAQSAQILKIRDAQTLLSQLGYEVGAPDGIAGVKTRDAVKSFEAVNGMPETGRVTEELLEKLEIAAGA